MLPSVSSITNAIRRTLIGSRGSVVVGIGSRGRPPNTRSLPGDIVRSTQTSTSPAAPRRPLHGLGLRAIERRVEQARHGTRAKIRVPIPVPYRQRRLMGIFSRASSGLARALRAAAEEVELIYPAKIVAEAAGSVLPHQTFSRTRTALLRAAGVQI